MNFSFVTAQKKHLADWLRLREDLYRGINRSFHEQEMELYLADATKECFLAIDGGGMACGLVEVSLRNVVDGCLSSPVGYIEGIVVDPE